MGASVRQIPAAGAAETAPFQKAAATSGGARAGRARALALAGVCSALALALAWSLNFQIEKKHQFML